MNHVIATNPAALSTQSVHALASVICPDGKCRPAVRGFSASNFRSTILLNAIAHVRAIATAPKINTNNFHPGHPLVSRAARAMDAIANGIANTVCDNFTNSPHLTTSEITVVEPPYSSSFQRGDKSFFTPR